MIHIKEARGESGDGRFLNAKTGMIEMGVFRKFTRAAEQAEAMAAQLGVDVNRDLRQTPDLQAARLRNRIFRCAWCGHHEDCAKRLEADDLTEAPDYCRNKAEFDGLLLRMVENA
ncbi:MAG: DUF6455 family protein [Pseudomonadota bacterium]